MDKKEELLCTLCERREQFQGKVKLKGAFFLFENHYYPIKLVFSCGKSEESYECRESNYVDLLLIEDWFDPDVFSRFVDLLGENTEFEISSHKIIIPKGYFRALDEDQNKIVQEYGGYSHLSDFEKKCLKETRSFPRSALRQWPARAYLFKFHVENNCNNLYNQKSWEPLPIKKDLPAMPDYHTAIHAWLGKDLFYFNDWMILFYLPDFRARIKEVRLSKNRFVINPEEGFITKQDLVGKYYFQYTDLSSEHGEIDFIPTNQIQIDKQVQRFYFVLHDKGDLVDRIDYRDYDWRHPYTTLEGIDIEHEEEDIEYWVAQGENERVEFKLTVDGKDRQDEEKKEREFLESVCSFSNTLGGKIVVGVDDNGNIRGVDETQVERYEQKLPDLIRYWIEPPVEEKVESAEIRGRNILVVNIPKGTNPPYNYMDHGVYIRAGKTDRIAKREELISLMPREEKHTPR